MAQAAENKGKKIHLRVQNPKMDLDVFENSTVQEIMTLISKQENIEWEYLQLMDRSNFPPKTISTNPYLTLKELNVASQTVISVRKLNSKQNFDQFKPQIAQQNQNNNKKQNESKVNDEINNNNNSNNSNNSDDEISSNNGRIIREKIADDNSCLFNAIQMCKDETHNLDNGRTIELREMVASIILSDSDTYNSATLENRSNNEYAQWIMKPQSWGGEIELSILSNILEIIIVTIDIETLKLFKYGNENQYKKTIYLLYSGIHYDSAIMEYVGDAKKTYKYQFDSNNDFILAQVLSLAQELNKNQEFTNVFKFTLMCADCGKGIIGQNGALEHAKQTGHANFQEYKKT